MIRHLARTGSLIALAAALAGCGSGGSSGNSSPSTGQPAAGTSSGKTIAVSEKEFSITVAGSKTLQPGTYTFAVTNNGKLGHNLTIDGPGVQNKATPTFTSGTQKLTVTLQNGSYTLFCSVPGHRQQGMVTKLTVGSGGSGGGGGGGGGGY